MAKQMVVAIYQEIDGGLSGGVFSMPTYFNNTVYFAAVGDSLKAFSIANAKLGASAASKSATSYGYPGASPSISANGTRMALYGPCRAEWQHRSASRVGCH